MLNRLIVCVSVVFFILVGWTMPAAAITLAPCPDSPNCVLSEGADSHHGIKPLVYRGDRTTAYATLLRILTVVPRTVITNQTDNYIHAQSSSRLPGFVDDLEFYFPANGKLIQVRSAARSGYFDFGLNRTRLEQIRLALRDLGA